jgi:hypothetical protein
MVIFKKIPDFSNPKSAKLRIKSVKTRVNSPSLKLRRFLWFWGYSAYIFFCFANFYVAYVDYVDYYVDCYVVCNSMKRGCNLPSLKNMSPIKESMRDNICNGP